MNFIKMHGLGNDFVVFSGPLELSAEQVVGLCDRRTGIGADGVLVVTPIEPELVQMEYWNADGSFSEMCGNGLRCVARYAVDRGWVEAADFEIVTAVGKLPGRMVDEQTAQVMVGTHSTEGTEEFAGMTFQRANVGNPHAVTFVTDLDAAPVADIGSQLEAATEGGVNVEFAYLADGRIDVRTWERGVGETLACGTGAVAVAAVAKSLRFTEHDTTIRLRGGDLTVQLIDNEAWITGPAVYSFSGVVAL